MPRNRTRAERAAAGVVDLGVSIPIELRDAIDTEAESQGLSRAGFVAEWAELLAKRQARKKTTKR